jgi:chloramphenicol 3-O phosphotransferase
MIAEVMLPWPEAREDLFRVLGRDDIFYVQLFCTLEELERRERQRGDRRQGLARSQFDRVYAFDGYDLQVDSTSRTPEECAQLIASEALWRPR